MLKTRSKIFDQQLELLKEALETKQKVTVILVNGYKYSDVTLLKYDRFTLLVVDERGKQKMFYKHAISTIIPSSLSKI